MSLQLVERAVPSFLVASARVLVVQTRMSESQFGAFGGRAKVDLDQRFAGIFAAFPPPAHRQSFRSCDLEVFAAALVLAAVESTEANPKTPTNTHINLGQQYRA